MAKVQASFIWAWGRFVQFVKAAGRRYSHLPIFGKLFVWAFALFVFSVATFILVIGPSTIAQKMYDIAQMLARRPFGWLILVTVMIVASFPPLVGYSTSVTLCGFAYGVKGIFIAGPSAVVGSAIVFVVLRSAFKKRVRKWASHNDKWQALEAVIREKGLPLIILIRVCPLPPWVYSNAFFSSIEAVALWQFIVATLFTLPKIFLTVFVGSRIARLADGKEREEMDLNTKLLNVFSIIFGIALSIIAGIVLYRLMQRQIKMLRESPSVQDELAAEALEEAEEATPLLNNLSSDSIDTGTEIIG